MGTAVVKKTHLLFQGVKYWTTNASTVMLGSYGRLRSGIFVRDRLEVHDQVSLKDLSVREATVVQIDWERSHEATLNAQLKVPGVPLEGSLDAKLEAFNSGNVKLVKLDVALNPLARALNGQVEHRRAFRRIKRTPRVVCQIFSILSHEEASKLTSTNDVYLDLPTGSGVEIGLGVGIDGSSQSSVSLSKDTTFAYMLAAPEWSKNEKRVAGFDYDQWSIA